MSKIRGETHVYGVVAEIIKFQLVHMLRSRLAYFAQLQPKFSTDVTTSLLTREISQSPKVEMND